MKNLLKIVFVLFSLFIVNENINAQTRVPNGNPNTDNSTNRPIENQSIFRERTTKNGLKIRPILIPYIGGGASSTNGFTNILININPMGGVAINNKFRIAAGPIFEYANLATAINTNGNVLTSAKFRTLGANIFAQYNILNLDDLLGKGSRGTRIFLHGEYAVRNAKDLNTEVSRVINSLPIGAGFTQPITNRTSFQGIVLYNPLDASLYENSGLTYRFGIGVGF